ncbi:unnamed protein product [Malus baccata var. baccata]
MACPFGPCLAVPLSLALLQTNPYELLSEVLCRQNGTIRFKGPWCSGLFGAITCDPRNLEYLQDQVLQFPQRPLFPRHLRDLLRDGIFSADSDKWQHQKKTASFEFHSAKFRKLTVDSLFDLLVHARLLPVLEDSIKH